MAVAVAAQPAAHAKDRRHVRAPGQALGPAFVEVDHGRQDRGADDRQRVADLVGDGDLHRPVQAGAPQQRDLAEQALADAGVQVRRQAVTAQGHQARNLGLAVDQRPAADLGRVGRQHRHDVELIQGVRTEAERLQRARDRMRRPGPDVGLGVAAAAGDVLADVGQHRMTGEGPRQQHGLIGLHGAEQEVQMGLRVAVGGGSAGGGDQIARLLAVEVPDRLVEQRVHQLDVGADVSARLAGSGSGDA